MMQQQMQGLPFPANAVIAPHAQPQFVPQATAPQFQQLMQPATMATFMVLQRNASKNALRIFLYNQMSANNFQNQEFVMTVQAVAELAAFQISNNQQFAANPQAAIEQSAESVCAMMAAVNAKNYQALYGFIDQNTAADVEQKAAEFMRLRQVLQQWKQSCIAPVAPMQLQQAPAIQNPWGNQQGMQQTGGAWNAWQQPQKPSTPLDVVGGAFKPMPESFTASGGQVQQLNLNPNQQQNFNAFSSGVFSMQEPAPAPEPIQAEKPQVSFGFKKGDAKPAVQTMSVTAAVHIGEEVKLEENAPVEAAKPAVKEEFYIDGCPVRHVAATDWKPSTTLENPYPTAYSPSTHTCFLQRHTDGTVEEVIVNNEDLTPEMEYAQHELKPSFKPQTKLDVDSGKVVIPNWSAVEKLESQTAPAKLEVDGIEIDPLIVQNRIDAPNLEAAELAARVELANQGVKSFSEDAIEFYYDENLVFCTSRQNMRELFESLHAAETAMEVQERFIALKGAVPDRIWYWLNQRATKAVNEMTTVNLQIRIHVDSFADDVAELVVEVEKDKGKIFSVALEEGIRQLVKRVFNLREVEYADGVPEDIFTYALTVSRSVTVVDWPSTAINVQIERSGSCIKESYTPDLYKALTGILQRSNEAGGLDEHVIVTSDNVILKVDRGLLGRDNILLSYE